MRNRKWNEKKRLYKAAASSGTETFVMRLAMGKMSQTIKRLKKSLAFQQRKYRLLQNLLLQASVECVTGCVPDDTQDKKRFMRQVGEYETYNRICSAMEGIDKANREQIIQGEKDVQESNLKWNLKRVLLFYEQEGWKVCDEHSMGIFFDSVEEMESFKAFALSGELQTAYKAFCDSEEKRKAFLAFALSDEQEAAYKNFCDRRQSDGKL